MTQDLRVAMTTSLNDKLVGPLRRSLDEVEKNLKSVEKELGQVTKESNQAGKAMGNMDGPAKAARHVAELARNTQHAVSLAERLKSAWSAAGNMMRGVMSGVAAYQAAKYVVSAPMQTARSYDRQLADASNTAFSDRDLAGRKAGMSELDAAVQASVRSGGGTREQALQGLQKLLANGVSFEQARATMPDITKAATASGASTVEIAEIVTKLLKDGFDPKIIKDAIGKAIAAGQAGSFEMKDMAQWIPKLLAGGKMSGLGGMADYERMLAMAQVSSTTAGGSAEAGNNLLNFLLKINSADTANDAKKLGIDLSGSLAAARAKGVSSPDAFMELLRATSDADPRLVKLRKQFAGASGDKERMESLKAQEAILQGSSIGKLVQDRQALMPVIALLNNMAEYSRVLGVTRAGGANTTEGNFSLIAGTADYRLQQAANEKLFAQSNGLSPVNEALAKLADVSTDFYRAYPAFSAVVEDAKLAIMGLAAAAGAAGLANLAMGGGVAATAAGVAAGLGGRLLTGLGAAGTALGGGSAIAVGAAGAAGVGIGTLINSAIEGTALHDEIGKLAAAVMAGFGNTEAKESLEKMAEFDGRRSAEQAAAMQRLEAIAQRPIVITVDGQVLADTLNSTNGRTARRN